MTLKVFPGSKLSSHMMTDSLSTFNANEEATCKTEKRRETKIQTAQGAQKASDISAIDILRSEHKNLDHLLKVTSY